ncbi:MAG: hypothetical protein Q9174_006353 [Haloplaca sp. 1 TL-2023]
MEEQGGTIYRMPSDGQSFGDGFRLRNLGDEMIPRMIPVEMARARAKLFGTTRRK